MAPGVSGAHSPVPGVRKGDGQGVSIGSHKGREVQGEGKRVVLQVCACGDSYYELSPVRTPRWREQRRIPQSTANLPAPMLHRRTEARVTEKESW